MTLITGASGKLGGYLVREALRRSETVEAWTGNFAGQIFGVETRPFDLTDEAALERAMAECRADRVIHTAALSEVKDCWADFDRALRVNRDVTGRLSDWCHRTGRHFLSVSTDMVFDGESAPYGEEAPPDATSAYGRSKIAAEAVALEQNPDAAVVRVALMIGPALTERRSFFDLLVERLQAREALSLFTDEWRSVLPLRVAAATLLDLKGAAGILHLGGPERVSRFELGMRTAAALGLSSAALERGLRTQFQGTEPRPRDLTLTCGRLGRIDCGSLEEEVKRMMSDARQDAEGGRRRRAP